MQNAEHDKRGNMRPCPKCGLHYTRNRGWYFCGCVGRKWRFRASSGPVDPSLPGPTREEMIEVVKRKIAETADEMKVKVLRYTWSNWRKRTLTDLP